MKLFKTQLEAVQSNKKVTTLIGGMASGKTYTSIAKAIMNQGKITIIVDSSLKEYVKTVYDSMLRELKEYNHKLTILDYDEINKLTHQDLIILEDFDIFDYEDALEIYHKIICFTQKVMITATPLSNFPLDSNFCYQLSKMDFVNNIQLKLIENEYLPKEFLKTLEKIFDSNQYPHYIKGTFTYKSPLLP